MKPILEIEDFVVTLQDIVPLKNEKNKSGSETCL